jgi:hypothetical protein
MGSREGLPDKRRDCWLGVSASSLYTSFEKVEGLDSMSSGPRTATTEYLDCLASMIILLNIADGAVRIL